MVQNIKKRKKNTLQFSTAKRELFEKSPLQHLKENYNDVNSLVSFLNPAKVYKFYNGRLKMREIKSFLQTVENYSLTKREKRASIFNYTISWHVFDIMQCDLIDISKISQFNDGYKFILCVQDVHSRYLYTELIRNKKCKSSVIALEKIFQLIPRSPNVIISDNGGEFTCTSVGQLCTKYKIRQFFTQGDYKASIVEKTQLSLQRLIFKYLIEVETFSFYKVLQKLTRNYNQSFHLTIKMKPSDAVLAKNAELLASRHSEIKAKMRTRKLMPRFKIDDDVRVSFKRTPFSRGYEQSHTNTLYKVAIVQTHRLIPSYKLKNNKSEILRGIFYGSQLQKVKIQDFRGHVISTRVRGGVKEHLFKFRGYEEPEWIKDNNVKKIGGKK